MKAKTFMTRSLAFITMVFVTSCVSNPVRRRSDEDHATYMRTIVPNESDGKIKVANRNIGSAVAPVVGAVVGPLLVNIANGITNGITSTLTSGYEPLNFGHDPHPSGHYNMYLVHFDDESQPYLLLDTIGQKDRPQYYGAASSYNHQDVEKMLSVTNSESDHSGTSSKIVIAE